MHARAAASVTIVTGIPRSGTSLLLQMLAAGGQPVLTDGVRGADADNPNGYFEYEPAKRLARDASWLPLAAGRAIKLVPTLLPELPPGLGYRVLLVRRALDEVLVSQRVMLARRGGVPVAAEEARLRAAFEAQLARLEAWLAARAELAWLALDHAALLAEPEAVAGRVSAFLGGGLDVAAMARCVDPALYRQRRQPSAPGCSR
jgi:hypothetical protein